MPSFAVRNFGCRVNQAEAFAWAEAFRERGLRLETDCSRSDVVVVNSCTLTGRAERDVRKFIRAVHRGDPRIKIVVTGCYAERAPADLASLAGVVSVLPQSAKPDLAGMVAGLDVRRTEVSPAAPTERRVEAGKGDMYPVRVPDRAEPSFRARGWLKIQDGCDNRCAYCVIPSVRGRSRSVLPAECLRGVRGLAARGFREIVLAGIHLSSYGEDLEPRASLSSLLRELSAAAGPARLRLSSLDPRKTDAAIIDHIAGAEAICPHVHLSLQHASGRVLRAMGRPVEEGSYDATLEELRSQAPDAALGADLMVGFPGETDADFDELRALLDRSPLTYAHVFSYSPRPGTAAGERRPLPAGVVTVRAKSLRRLAALKDYRFRRRFIGRELEAVVIRKSEAGAEVLTGNFISVHVLSCPAPERERVRVAVRQVLPRRTEGEVIG